MQEGEGGNSEGEATCSLDLGASTGPLYWVLWNSFLGLVYDRLQEFRLQEKRKGREARREEEGLKSETLEEECEERMSKNCTTMHDDALHKSALLHAEKKAQFT